MFVRVFHILFYASAHQNSCLHDCSPSPISCVSGNELKIVVIYQQSVKRVWIKFTGLDRKKTPQFSLISLKNILSQLSLLHTGDAKRNSKQVVASTDTRKKKFSFFFRQCLLPLVFFTLAFAIAIVSLVWSRLYSLSRSSVSNKLKISQSRKTVPFHDHMET